MVKKIIKVIFLSLFISVSAYSSTGYGDLKLTYNVVQGFIKYLDSNSVHNHTLGADQKGTPLNFSVGNNGNNFGYAYCPRGNQCRPSPSVALNSCRQRGGKNCQLFARGRTIVWNKVNYRISRKATREEIQNILTDLGFYGSNTSSKKNTPKITKKNDSKSVVADLKKKVEKRKKAKLLEKEKEPKKVVKKYELKDQRSIALSWEGYDELIAGTVDFNEIDYKGILKLPLPNYDGTCEGTYSLQAGGKGTWQITCSNNLGAAGTLKWIKNGGVTGIGRDYNEKKVKFTVSKNG